MSYLISLLELFQHELLLFGAFWLLMGAIDDALIDLIWIVRRVYRQLKYYRVQQPMSADDLPPPTVPACLPFSCQHGARLM